MIMSAVTLDDVMPEPEDLKFEPFTVPQIASCWPTSRYELLAYARYQARRGSTCTAQAIRMAVQLADREFDGMNLGIAPEASGDQHR
jgi:hypothetical protein